jgi:diguanylate cyclase (GGDEF)-like protein/PAS domain S-box-containing protein
LSIRKLLRKTTSPFSAQIKAFKQELRARDEQLKEARAELAALVEITAQKHTLKALLSGEARYRALADWSSEAINVLRDGQFIYLNPVAIKLYGASSAHELLGQSARDRVHPDDHHKAMARMKNLTRHRVSAPLIEMRFVKLDGTVMEVQAQATAIDYEGAPAIHVAWRDITALKRSELAVQESTLRMKIADQVLHLAFADPLTSLPNRRVLHDRVNQTQIASKRTGYYGALMFIDLDNFKQLNDSQGHEAGDLLLIEVAARLKNCVREMDTVARFGGDEFVVMLSHLSADKVASALQARIIAEKISETIALPYRLALRHEVSGDTAIEHVCTASIGVTLFINDDASHDDILKQADTAMYQAKKSGQNLIRFHDLPV